VKEDTLTTSQEIYFLRLKTEEQARNGTSIETQEPSDLEKKINLLISRNLVKTMFSNTTQPTQDGGKSGNSMALKKLQRRDQLLLVKSSTQLTEE
jgi:hypothetical protein